MVSDDEKPRNFVSLSFGTLVSHYRIIEKIGAGGMGEVYRAHDDLLDRDIAVKFLSGYYGSDDNLRRRFLREARAAARLHHRNIVTTLDVGEHQGKPYIVFEYFESRTLRQRLAEGQMAVDETLRISLGIAEAIGTAHRHGVIHRDIKPSNILLDSQGYPKLVDFGLAVLKTPEEETRTVGIVGTVGYMAPEQASGSDIDERSDLFSLGVVMYEMLTGVNPFRRESELASLAALWNDEPHPIREFRAGVPERLIDIVMTLLQKEPSYRYQCAEHLRDDLRTCTLGHSVTTPLRTGPCVSENRLVVLPFAVFEESACANRLGEIFAHLIITGLSDLPDVDVVSDQRLYDLITLEGREGAVSLDRSVATRLARRAEARWMLLGNVLSQTPLILTTQLIDVYKGLLLKGHRFALEPGTSIFTGADAVLAAMRTDLNFLDASPGRLVPVTQLTTSSPDALRHYINGFMWQCRWDEQRAKEEYSLAIDCDPTFAMAYYGLASIPVPDRLALIAKAEALAEQATFRERCYIKALRLRLEGNRHDSMAVLQELLDRHPNEKLAHFWIGVNLHYLNDFNAAIPHLRKAIELDPLFTSGYNQLIYTLNRAGQFEESMVVANQYIQLAPDDPNPYDSRGEVLGFNGRIEAALASYHEALARTPVLVPSIQRCGILHVLNQDYECARELFDRLPKYVESNPWIDPHFYQVTILLRQGRWMAALEYLDRGIAEDQRDPQRAIHVGFKHGVKALALLEVGKHEEALQECQTALTYCEAARWWFSHGPNLYLLLARLLAQNGFNDEAKKLVNSKFGGAPEHDVARRMRYFLGHGLVHFHGGASDQAMIELERAEQIQPRWLSSEHFLLESTLGKLYLKYQRPDRTVKLLEDSMRTFAESRAWHMIGDVQNHYYLGRAYEQSGWNEKACEQYKMFLTVWSNAEPGFSEIEDAGRRLAYLRTQ